MIGQTIAHYLIEAKLGEGGMGEVCRARDTKLNRDVALKILPQVFAQDTQRMARFEREAQVLASLNHANIAQIHGLEESDGTKALALELVEGETLQEQIARGPIPADEALKIALQICEEPEAAHEKGIIQSDLKPANIEITPEGQVKILDFGLAKALEGETPVSDLPHPPKLTQEGTRAGMVLGAAAYMSSEQARGKPVDKHTDIWALGCVLYEMLAGRKAFGGDTSDETVSDVPAAVLKRDPIWESVPRGCPVSVGQALRRCPAKEIRYRLQAIGDAPVTLEDVLADKTLWEGAAVPSSIDILASVPFRYLPLILLAGVAMVLAYLAVGNWQSTAKNPLASQARRLSINLPEGFPVALVGSAPALSPRRDSRCPSSPFWTQRTMDWFLQTTNSRRCKSVEGNRLGLSRLETQQEGLGQRAKRLSGYLGGIKCI